MKRGFTLIELLAVIILLGVVTLIVYPNVNATILDSKNKALEKTIGSLRHAAYMYTVENHVELNDEEQPILLTKLVSDGYLKEIPTNPITREKLTGCIMYKWDNNQYEFRYDENCSMEYTNNGEANAPILFNKMIPVIYENNNWVYADINEEWYDYDNKQWANAVVLNDEVTKNVGQTISESEIALMYVWIPRYKYTIFNGNNGTVSEQEINIEFENGTNSTGTVMCNDDVKASGSSSEVCSDSTNGSIINGTSTYTHPAFCFGHRTNGVCDGNELTGIWIGKFEISAPLDESNTIQKVTIKPNVYSWVDAQIATFYTSIGNIASDYGINFDSHMIKNMEWGAVAYLTQSKYGRCIEGTCTEIAKNDSDDMYTGRSQGIVPPTGNSSSDGTYQYYTSQGWLASTTGNIYGIYDMSGGAWESVMGNMVDSSNQFYSSSAGFSTTPDSKYYDSYTYDSSSDITHSRGKLGDAMKEILKYDDTDGGGWFDDYTDMPYGNASWFYRSGDYSYSTINGVFCFSHDRGDTNSNDSTRAVGVSPN